ncbi:MAG: hypothetical protein A3F41_05935 [Coxiella sp. RIFCSPHIGHO2_12_FULL_44_14]|nr:MAG: hypothetical protein A3F41_05935 [Coxiella sp. RIFCSPHIGHO2_12_FULL_44_14]
MMNSFFQEGNRQDPLGDTEYKVFNGICIYHSPLEMRNSGLPRPANITGLAMTALMYQSDAQWADDHTRSWHREVFPQAAFAFPAVISICLFTGADQILCAFSSVFDGSIACYRNWFPT